VTGLSGFLSLASFEADESVPDHPAIFANRDGWISTNTNVRVRGCGVERVESHLNNGRSGVFGLKDQLVCLRGCEALTKGMLKGGKMWPSSNQTACVDQA
jgi:hypothetical protein